MKRSRIICSIVTVIYVIVSVALILILLKSNMYVKSSVPTYLKAVYVAMFALCTFLYAGVKTRLAKKLTNKALSITISKIYYYIYLAVIAFVSKFAMAYILRETPVTPIIPGFSSGLGSYINYGLGLLVDNQFYANAIVNSILAFASCVVIKKILLNITDNDTIATVASIMYLFIPQSLVYVMEYIKYNYNVILVLIGIFVFTKIIDEVKNFGKKNNKYLIYALILGAIQSLDVIFGGSYVLWICMMLITTLAATYVDTVHIHINFKEKLHYKLKRIAEKIERINISKLICVSLIALVIAGITTLVCAIVTTSSNYKIFNVENASNILMHSRNYYLVLVIFALVFEIIGVLLKRELDIKMFNIKVSMITIAIISFFMVDSIYASALFDTLLALTVITNACNICYNREERIKLLKDKN